MSEYDEIVKDYFFISTSWGKGVIAKHFIALSNALVNDHKKVVILVTGHRKGIDRHDGNPAIYSWPSKRPTRFVDAYFLFKLIKRFKPKCLVANFGAVNIMMLIGWLLRVPRRVVWCHTMSGAIKLDGKISHFRAKFLELRKALIYKLVTHFVAVSEAACLDYSNTYKIPLNKFQVFYNSLTDPAEALQEMSGGIDKRGSLVCVGRLDLGKGQDVLIKAVSMLERDFPNLKVKFIGEGDAKDYYLKLVADLRLEEKCSFPGVLPHDEVMLEMARAYATICPSIFEAFGLVNIESMAVSTPVIASSVGGIPEIVRDGVDGFLVPPGNPEALAEKLRLLLSKPDLRESMAKNAREQFVNKFEQKEVMMGLAQWLENI